MSVTLSALSGVPIVSEGDKLCLIALTAVQHSGLSIENGDILVVAQKIVSKAEGRLVRLAEVEPSDRARELACACDKDPRLVELILTESAEVLRVRKGVLIVRHRLGLVLANAGIDQSNVDHGDGEAALLLPLDPDASARRLQESIVQVVGAQVGVVVIDSLGRAWRNGVVGTAIGVAGIPAVIDLRGVADLYGRVLRSTEIGFADEIAAAASAVMGQAGERTPIVHVRGFVATRDEGARASDLVRSRETDLFP